MRRRQKHKRSWPSWGLLLIFPFVWIGQSQFKGTLREPQAMLVLGGDPEREHFAAEFAQQNPDLEVWISSGTNPEYAHWIFQEADISPERVHLDYRAVDTVTNFTTLAADLKSEGIHDVYLVTSDYHMRRATVIGQVVLSRYDITFQTLPVPSEDPSPEPLTRSVRDGARAVWWIFTGQTGSSLGKPLG
jgi:uncharacterized SAM-binding protein YcdF (DUF218 family)